MKLFIRVLLVLFCLRISPLNGFAQSGIVSTIAGNGTAGFSGDAGSAISAQLSGPDGVAVDASGSLYIADSLNNRIRKVTTDGVISTVAGTGSAGFSGDGGPATSAQLNAPQGVAVDPFGNLYIADTLNSRVRKVDSGGVISTFAGTGIPGFSGDQGPATSARLSYPHQIAMSYFGILYIADTLNHRVRQIDGNRVIMTLAGTGSAGFGGDFGNRTLAQLNAPEGVAVDMIGNIYIADTLNSRVRKVNEQGVISTVAGTGSAGFSGDGGLATSAQLNNAHQIAVDLQGNVYIADFLNQRIRKVTSGGAISTVAGTGSAGFSGDGGLATSAQLNSADGVAVDAVGNLYIGDSSNNRARKIDLAIDAALSNPRFLRGDFDGDGKTDILWQHSDGSTGIWLMNGLSPSSWGALVGPGTGWSVNWIADFNGDGKSDILWQHSDGSTGIWLMNGVSPSSWGGLVGPGTGWSVRAIGDFNGDGKSDIVWQHTDGSSFLWLMNGVSPSSWGGLVGPGTGWSVRQIGDFNGDGKSDILWQRTDYTSSIWLMNGVSPIISGQLREGTKAFGAGWDAIQIGDFNGDGKSDILWERRSDLARSIFLMNGLSANFQTFSGPLGPLANGRWTVQQIGDFNGDGKSDIVWQETFGSVVIWLMDGLSPSNNTQVLGTETGWSVSRIGDFNGDGKSDILWQHTDGSITMWIMNGLSLTISGGLLGPGTGWHPAP